MPLVKSLLQEYPTENASLPGMLMLYDSITSSSTIIL